MNDFEHYRIRPTPRSLAVLVFLVAGCVEQVGRPEPADVKKVDPAGCCQLAARSGAVN